MTLDSLQRQLLRPPKRRTTASINSTAAISALQPTALRPYTEASRVSCFSFQLAQSRLGPADKLLLLAHCKLALQRAPVLPVACTRAP
eukprot:3880563-Rhodomonas_salina.1